MNWIFKIILLIAGLAVAVLGIVYFAKSIVEPPVQTEFDNLHLISLHNDVKSLKQPSMDGRADSVFDTTLHASRFWSREGLISLGQSDTIIEQLVNNYTPLFLKRAYKHFEGSSWSEDENNALYNRAHLLKGLRFQTTRKYTLDGDLRIQVDSVKIIIDSYNAAHKLASDLKYVSLEDSRDRIESAKNYAKQKYIKNCTSLTRKLVDELPKKLEKAHFEHLQRRVFDLESCTDKNIFNDVARELEVYKDSANDVYGTAHSSESLNALEELAEYYFQLLPNNH